MRAFFPATTGAAMLLALASMSGADADTSYTYTFDSTTAAGVAGTIKVKYADSTTTSAAITADLDFTNVKLSDLTNADAKCTALPTDYAYSIHVSWPTNATAASVAYAQCANSEVGGRLDPLNACSTESENAATTNCTGKTYTCTPAAYTTAATACEKGDLSGKNGNLKVDTTSKKATVNWTDTSFPAVSDFKQTWNIVLRAVCGTDTPPVACAVGKLDAAATTTNSIGTTNSTSTTKSTTNSTTTPAPTTSAAGHSGVLNGVVVATGLLMLLATLL